MLRITLIDPKGTLEGLNTGLGYLAGALISKGFDPEIIDFNNYPANFLSRLKAISSPIIGISIKTATLPEAVKIARIIKQHDKSKIIVGGGPGVTLLKEDFIKQYPIFDAGIIGEGENSFLELVKALAGQQSLDEVEGIVYKYAGQIKYTQYSFIKDLDALPYPNYEVFDSIKRQGIKSYPLVTSRGCPYQCSYCVVPKVSGPQWRSRTIANVIDELQAAIKKHQIKNFRIKDDNFTLDEKRVAEFCEALLKNTWNLKWGCVNGFRADTLNFNLLSLMKKAGCEYISIGIESLDQEVFENLNKGETLQDITATVKYLQKAGIKVIGQFILGLPYSNYQKDCQTVKKTRELGLNAAIFNYFIAYPQTPIWEQISEKRKGGADWEKSSQCVEIKPVVSGLDYPASLKIKMYYQSNLLYKNYHLLAAFNDPFYKKVFKLITAILRYDLIHTGDHFMALGNLLIKRLGNG
ncbi:MAG TPA: radical SAM protein [Candidatus Omnitrophota bacterium]|nr:radical SAM protein [Candidatus Omnitrophota bacterium]HPT39105.1 radical SAM protein [Candidatus Omnitrophota bacterium]